MKLAQFKTKGSEQQKLGIALGDVVCDVAELARAVQASGGEPAEWLLNANSTLEVIRRGAPAIKEIDALITHGPSSARGQVSSYLLDEIEFLPAVYPQKILAIGRNYVDHAIEGGAEPPKAPLIFNKLSNSLSAHTAPIVLPTISSQVDYEAELAVIIGRNAKRIDAAAALDYVFGYVPFFDISTRGLVRRTHFIGKGQDTHGCCGPWIITKDEIPDPHNVVVKSWNNGEPRQNYNTSAMAHKIPDQIAWLSKFARLSPGDIVATGTPAGVGPR